jgi:hypothetical protein
MDRECETLVKTGQTAGNPETKIHRNKKAQTGKAKKLLGALLHYPQGQSPLERGISHWR